MRNTLIINLEELSKITLTYSIFSASGGFSQWIHFTKNKSIVHVWKRKIERDNGRILKSERDVIDDNVVSQDEMKKEILERLNDGYELVIKK